MDDLHRQSEMYKLQPPKLTFKQSSKFAQFMAPLLAGNTKTWLLGLVDEKCSQEGVNTLLSTLTRLIHK